MLYYFHTFMFSQKNDHCFFSRHYFAITPSWFNVLFDYYFFRFLMKTSFWQTYELNTINIPYFEKKVNLFGIKFVTFLPIKRICLKKNLFKILEILYL